LCAKESDKGLYFEAEVGGETEVATVQKDGPVAFVFLVPNRLIRALDRAVRKDLL
jgi:hypothetical protein